jgi:type IV pilus assembly protein PilB
MSIKLGEMLLNNKVITEAQLKDALEKQQQIGGKLGTILTKLRYVTEDQFAKFLSEQLKIPLFQLPDLVVHPSVSALMDVELLMKHQVVPIKKSEDRLLVAAADPMDLDGLDDIHFVTGLRVEAGVATRTNILKAIDYYFRGKPCPEITNAEIAKGVTSGMHAAVKDGTTRASPQAVLQALVELLIEKKLITQQELLAKVEKGQKK